MAFHSRRLVDESEKNDFNAWDCEEISGEVLLRAKNKLDEDKKQISKNKNLKESVESQKSWEMFYSVHSSFFKNRKWIVQEFDGILNGKKIFEMGCGVGNSLHWFSVLNEEFEKNENFDLKEFERKNEMSIGLNIDTRDILPYELSGCDFSINAVEMCDEKYTGVFFVHDLMSDEPINGEYDTILLIFTLSAIDPVYHTHVMNKAYNCLKKGGKLYFKDFGVLDMVQLRYKPQSILDENFYQRSDGTLTYFFSLDYFKSIVKQFTLINLQLDKRLLINRKRNLDMYRVFVQAIIQKD